MEFLARMEKEKAKNSLYSKTNITMKMKTTNHGFPSNRSESDVRSTSFSGLTLNSITKLIKKKKINKTTAVYINPKPGIEHSYSHNHLLDLTRKAGVIANDSPYLSPLAQIAKEAQENKKKWIGNQNFLLFVNKAHGQNNIVKNYVRITPSIPASNYMFRGIYKDKWVDKKDFISW